MSATYIINLDGAKYTANSGYTLQGRDDKNDNIGDFSGVRTLSKEDIRGVLGYADFVFYTVYGGKSKEQAVMQESNAGPLKKTAALLDFKNRLYELFNFKNDELIVIDGIAYNANEAGNYLWGLALREAGIVVNPKNIAELATKGRHDEPHEQKAIQAGMNKATSLVGKTDESSKDFRKLVYERYTEEWAAFKSDGGGAENYVPSDNLGIFKEYRETHK